MFNKVFYPILLIILVMDNRTLEMGVKILVTEEIIILEETMEGLMVIITLEEIIIILGEIIIILEEIIITLEVISLVGQAVQEGIDVISQHNMFLVIEMMDLMLIISCQSMNLQILMCLIQIQTISSMICMFQRMFRHQ